MATSDVVYVYRAPVNGGYFAGIPARDLTQFDLDHMSATQRHTVKNAMSGGQRVYVPIGEVTETEQERIAREAAEAAARAAARNAARLVYGYDIDPLNDKFEALEALQDSNGKFTRAALAADVAAAVTMAQPKQQRKATIPKLTLQPTPMLTGTTLYGFNVINARNIWGGAALDTYYSYASTDHGSAGGVTLRTAPTPTGPWTSRGMIYVDTTQGSQTETPNVVWDDANNRLNMYYQQTGVGTGAQSTLLAYSTDGRTNWTRVGVVMDAAPAGERAGDGHTGYARIFRIGRDWYADSLYGGTANGWRARWWSADGLTWVRQGTRVAKQRPGLTTPGTLLGLGQVFWWNGDPWLICGIANDDSSGVGAGGGAIGIVPLLPDYTTVAGTVTLFAPSQAFQSTDHRWVSVYVDGDGTIYVYWLTDTNLAVGVLA